MDQHNRATENRGTADRGVGSRTTRDDENPNHRPNVRIAQRPNSASAPFPAVAPDHRTIFVAYTPPFSTLPQDVRVSATAELIRLFAFVGAGRGRKAITVRLTTPANYPESLSFTDATVATTADTTSLQAYVDDAIRIQVANAVFSLDQRGVVFNDPFARRKKGAFNPERTGTSRFSRFVQRGRAFPFIASVVAIDEVMSDFVDEIDSRVQVDKVRKRRKDATNTKYWMSKQSLQETAIMSVLDNPKAPDQWLFERPLFGAMIGRAMAHEVRHLYVGTAHARAGLGSDGVLLARPAAEAFSRPDQAAILNAIQRLERQQGRNPVVTTFPAARRTDFPF